MAKAASRKTAVKKGGSIGLSILGFLMLLLGFMMMPTSLLLAAGMLPTAVAYLIDLDPRKTAAVSVGTLNICGVLPFEIALWKGSNSVPHAMLILADLETWATMYGAAALGWVIYYTVPPAMGAFVAYRSTARLQELQRRQASLRDAWGAEVRGASH